VSATNGPTELSRAEDPGGSADPGVRCSGCGARSTGSQWCTLCHRQLSGESGSGPAFGAVFGAGRTVVAGRVVDSAGGSLGERQWSRWRGGPNSFGPVGRVLLTVGLVGLIPLLTWMGGQAALYFDLVYLMGPLPWFLRDVWKRQRVG